MSEIPKKYKHVEAESRWRELWESWGIHRWNPEIDREQTFVVDTPPPTVSGSLHVGHVFSYTHQDLIVRFQRMQGKNIAYPMGWDDNGLPTERRVQNILGVRCDPALPYDGDWQARFDKTKKELKSPEWISRRNFIEACQSVTEQDEKAFEELWRHLGLSIDWSQTYATIDERSRGISQASFLDLYDKGFVDSVDAPTMWDVDFQTAVAQAEVEDRPRPGAFHDIRFAVEGGGELMISTTRPELLAACIAVVAHPDDERYQALFGKQAITPLYGVRVPILAAEHAEPEKGTGILMVCTFGDSHDVEWWKHSGLALRQVIGRDGRMQPVSFGEAPFECVDAAAANAAYAEIAGLKTHQAKKRIAELLADDGSMVGEPRVVEHPVKYYEKGDRPLEFVPTRQWFIKVLEHREQLLAQGAKIKWHPPHMRNRYDTWVEGLNQDWCVSRQRYFGVPFPIWYHLDAEGRPSYGDPIIPDKSSLPVDPLSDPAPGFEEKDRGQPGGFIGDPDVMDTWATSSMSPEINSHWGIDDERHPKWFPADVRPQAHEIIRTWAFYTICKAWMHGLGIPWKNVVISGWVLAPKTSSKNEKMSKSKGNAVTPQAMLDEFSSDAVRYWTARARLGVDTAFDPTVFKVGKRLTNKVFNASRFVFGQIERVIGDDGEIPGLDAVCEATDLAMLAKLTQTIDASTAAFEGFDYASALQHAEAGFWDFCDTYLELVKLRSYEEEDTPGRRSALATLVTALSVYLRLLAPILPYVTEEVWSWRFATAEGPGRSIHTSAWPTRGELAAVTLPDSASIYELAADLLSEIRAAKSNAQKSLRWPVASVEVSGPAAALEALEAARADLAAAGNFAAEALSLKEAEAPEGRPFAVAVELAAEDDRVK